MGQELTDRECAELSQRGDHAAYSVLVRRYQDRIYRFLLRMVGSRDEALDLAQDVLIKAFQALPDWRPEAQFRTWLFRIASNAATDALRRRNMVEFVALDEHYDVPGESAGPEARLAARQQLRALDAALNRLAPDHREILLLREVEGMSYGEISAALGVTEGTVKSRLARARQALIDHYRRKNT